jgi:hypothetical protein
MILLMGMRPVTCSSIGHPSEKRYMTQVGILFSMLDENTLYYHLDYQIDLP